MKKLLGMALLTISIAISGCSRPRPYYAPPPPGYSQAGQQGFHDGLAAGHRDASSGVPPDVSRHGRFRRPPVPRPVAEEYRRGFSDGYQKAWGRGPGPAYR